MPSKLEREFINKMMLNNQKIRRALLAHGFSNELNIVANPFKRMRREYPWQEGSRSRLDFAWPLIKLGIEIQGGIFGTSRRSRHGHASKAGFIKDFEKFNKLQLLGWRILLFTPEDTNVRWDSYTLPLLVDHLTERLNAHLLSKINRKTY